jgi:hypothetical protein
MRQNSDQVVFDDNTVEGLTNGQDMVAKFEEVDW